MDDAILLGDTSQDQASSRQVFASDNICGLEAVSRVSEAAEFIPDGLR